MAPILSQLNGLTPMYSVAATGPQYHAYGEYTQPIKEEGRLPSRSCHMSDNRYLEPHHHQHPVQLQNKPHDPPPQQHLYSCQQIQPHLQHHPYQTYPHPPDHWHGPGVHSETATAVFDPHLQQQMISQSPPHQQPHQHQHQHQHQQTGSSGQMVDGSSHATPPHPHGTV